MTADDRKTLIAQYNDGYRVVAEALVGATDAELDARPAPGKWTAREVVHHLADSELTAATRLRLMVATDNPQIFGYDPDQFARALYYDRPIAASLDRGDPGTHDRRRLGAGGRHAHGTRSVHRRAMARAGRRPCAPPRRAD